MTRLKFLLSILVAVNLLFFSQNAIEAISPSRQYPIKNISSPLPAGTRVISSQSTQVLESYQSASGVQTPGLLVFNDPYYKDQWSPEFIELTENAPANSVVYPRPCVALLDTGIDPDHEDLAGKVVSLKNFTSSGLAGDLNGHGTHLAGIIAAGLNNATGISGMAPGSRLMSVKVAEDRGSCQSDTLAAGIVWAVDNGANIINISIEIQDPLPELERAIDYAWNKGAVIVAAASNQTIAPVYPAYYKNCLAVAPTDRDSRLGPLTYNQEWVDIAAPGFAIFSTLPSNSYGYMSGTSMAAAHVSGLAALLFSRAVDRNGDGKVNDEIRTAIERGARPSVSTGIRIIDVKDSIAFISH